MRNALYRIYRPQNFDEVEGQKHVAITLRNAAKEGRFAHAYLMTGTRGTGKTTMARIVAKAINCASLLPDGNPCNVCEFCLGATQGRLVDIIEIDAASNNSVDQIRDLTERALFQPVQAKKKVYIIDEVHMLSNSAANALLKTLEEPPEHVHFILATTEQHKILPTIISRCQVFHFLPLADTEIVSRLAYVANEEKISLSPEALAAVAVHARGGMRDALSLLERLASTPGVVDEAMVNDILGSTAAEHLRELCDAVVAADIQKALQVLQDAQQRGASPDKFLRSFKNVLRERLIGDALNHGVTDTARRLMQIADRIEQSLGLVRYADIPWLHCELAILHACDTEAPKATPVSKPKAVAAPVFVSPAPSPAPIAPSKEVPKPTPTPVVTSPVVQVAEAGPDPVQRLKKEWQSFTFKIPSTIVRTALKSTKVEGVDSGDLVLVCQSAVQFAYLSQEENVATIRTALETHYHIDMPLRILLAQEAEAKLVTPEFTPAPAPVEAPSEEDNILKVADLFGGTVIS